MQIDHRASARKGHNKRKDVLMIYGQAGKTKSRGLILLGCCTKASSPTLWEEPRLAQSISFQRKAKNLRSIELIGPSRSVTHLVPRAEGF